MANDDLGVGARRARHLIATEAGAIAKAAELVRQGELVIFPTDTVYGIGADPFSQDAVARLFQAKRRPTQKGIPVLLASLRDLKRVAANVPEAVVPILERFWPGPLTLVLPRRPELPDILSPDDSVAVRIPDHEVARELIRMAGGAVATSSANLSDHPPARSGLEAMAWLGDDVSAVLDDGESPGGVPSTVVDFRGSVPKILRPGPISADSLATEVHSARQIG